MNQGILAAIISILFYLANLLSGGQSQPIREIDPPFLQQSYEVLGQIGKIAVEHITIRQSPDTDGKPLGTATQNTMITILDKKDNWYKIRPQVGSDGWVPNYAVIIEEIRETEATSELLGFYPGGELAYNSLLENGIKLTSISALGWQLDSYGGLISNFDATEMGRSLYFAGNQKMNTYANIRIDSSPSPLLNTPYLQQKNIREITNTLKEWGLKGVLIDIDYVPNDDNSLLVQFLQELGTTLEHNNFKMMVALPWDNSIDYQTILNTANYIVLKTANRPSVKEPAPMISISDLEIMLNGLSSLVEMEKIILSLSTGGIKWSKTGIPEALTHKEILELAANDGASLKWDADSKAPYFQYGVGGTVWFENRYSIKYKLDLAKQFDLGGIALENIGQEDSDIWSYL